MGAHPFTLRQLQYAVAVAESLRFRQAAESCHVSQPSLSAQLAQLEAALGVRLFERDKRRVLLTAAGRAFIDQARVILRDANDLEELAHRTGDPFSGTLSIGVIPTISPYLLPRLTPKLRAAYPHLTVRWTEDKTRTLTEALEAGRLDAALLSLEAHIGEVEREIIARDPFVLVAPPGHALAATKTAVDVAALRDATIFVLEEEHCFGKQAALLCADTNAHIDAFRATSLTTLVQIVAAGEGVTLFPALAVPPGVTDAQLCVRHFAEPAPARTIALVWRKGYAFDAALRDVAATIGQALPAQNSGPREPSRHASRQQTSRPKKKMNQAARRARADTGR